MSEYSRRNRHSSPESNDDFDWDSFDKRTAHKSEQSGDPPPLRRRRSSSGSPKPAVRPHAEEDNYDAYEKNHTRQVSKSPERKKKRKKKLTEKQLMFRKRMRLTILIACLILAVVLSGMFIGMYAAVSREIKDMNLSNLALNYTSTIYYTDKNGNEVPLDTIKNNENRIWVESGDIAQCFKDAIVSIEDERFYKHNGVDIKRTMGATVKYALSKVGIGEANYGGSTITQQVIKNITREDDVKATRKIKEMMRAIALEKQVDKDAILTMYCNIVYFANSCNGVEAAANTYFNKNASDLNIQEAASIAGITQYPSEYDPLAHPDKNVEKRNTVLSKMYELGKITEAEYNMAVASPLETTDVHRASNNGATSYFVDQVVNDVIRDLINQKQYSEDFAESQVYNGGLRIYATIDTGIQSIMEDVFENTSNFAGGDSAEAAMVVIDPYTGQIKGLIGGLGEKTDIRGWNRATQSKRQPGSAIKPLSVYGPAVDLGKITEVDIVTDEEITIGNDNWKPKNSYKGFKGDMTIKEAVARSANIPAVKVLDKIGLSNSFGYLQNKFHLSTLIDEDKNYSSLALGGLTEGVTVKEMAAAYGVFVNSGKYITPYTYTKVLDSNGNVILENYINETQAMNESAAYITADLLSGPVNLSYGTAGKAKLSCGMPAYGKTGTTDDDYDKWFVGFTPYYVGAAWFGFDNPSSLSKAGISGNPCVRAWNLVFDQISSPLPYKELEKPMSVVEATVCAISGNLANNTCEAVKAYFVDGTQPKSKCKNHAQKKTEKTPEPTEEPKETKAPAEEPTAPDTPSSGSGGSSQNSGSGTSAGSSSGSHSSGGSTTGGTDTGGTSSSGSTPSDSGGGNTGGNAAPPPVSEPNAGDAISAE